MTHEELQKLMVAAANEPLDMKILTRFVGEHRIVCARCGKPKVEKSFYHIKNNRVYQSGRLPLCKVCINRLFHELWIKYQSPQKAMEKICMLFDLFYSDSMLNACKLEGNVVGRYIQKLNLRQNKYKRSYDQSKNRTL